MTIDLPKVLELIDKGATEPISGDALKAGVVQPSPVTWRIRAVEDGKHDVTVKTDSGLKQSRTSLITKTSLFN